MKTEQEKQTSHANFYRLVTKVEGILMWLLCSLAITYHILSGTITFPLFLVCSIGFVAGRFIQKTAYQD